MAYRHHYGYDTGLARNMLVNMVAAQQWSGNAYGHDFAYSPSKEAHGN